MFAILKLLFLLLLHNYGFATVTKHHVNICIFCRSWVTPSPMKRWFNSKGVTTLRSRTVNLEPPQEPSSLSRFSAREGRFQHFLRRTPGSAPTPTSVQAGKGAWAVVGMFSACLTCCSVPWFGFRSGCVSAYTSGLPAVFPTVSVLSKLEEFLHLSSPHAPTSQPSIQQTGILKPGPHSVLTKWLCEECQPPSASDSQCSRLPQMLSWRLVLGSWSSRLLSHRPPRTATQRVVPLI